MKTNPRLKMPLRTGIQLLATLIALAPHLALGSLSTDKPLEAQFLPPVCQILITDGRYTSGCSGTLIAPDAVLTSAHCFEKWDGPLRVSVACGYTSVDMKNMTLAKSKAGNKVIIRGAHFMEQATPRAIIPHPDRHLLEESQEGGPDDLRTDQAVVRLDRPLKIRPVSEIKGPGEIPASDECFSYGYGIQADAIAGRLSGGALRIQSKDGMPVHLNQSSLKLLTPSQTLVLKDHEWIRAALKGLMRIRQDKAYTLNLPGDSGGALLCRHPESPDSLYLAGISASVSITPTALRRTAQDQLLEVEVAAQSHFSRPDLSFIRRAQK